MNVYQNIESNKTATVAIIVAFIAFVTGLGWFLGYYFYGDSYSLVGLALIASIVTSIYSYYNSDKIVLSLSGAKPVTHDEAPDLYHLVENMSIASGIPVPKIYLINDTAMNAFATGRDPQHSVICFTTGIVNSLDKRELEGVVAHEMSHIGNYDIRLMTIVSVLVGTVTLVADWFTRGMFYGRGRKRSGGDAGGIILVIGLVFIVLSPIIAMLIKLALSRRREYLADASAAMITRYPEGLANALRKLAADKEVLEAANGATAHLYIVNPIREGIGAAVSNLFNTHPPIEERIRRLEQM